MFGHQAVDYSLSFLRQGMSFISAMQEAKSAKAWQKYNNAMTRLADAMNQNAITTNQNLAIDRSSAQAFEIERSEYTTLAQAEANAAAVGTVGRSVNQTMFQIERNAAVAQSRRQSDLKAQILGFEQQRKSSAMQMAQQLDYSYIPSPNPITYMMGFASDGMKIEDKYNPRSI